MPLIIKWNRAALNQLIKAIEYIREDSVQNAGKVKDAILAEVSTIAVHPEKLPSR